ncbi:MAG: flagellar FlbD family protein [Planctomycetes bacterium]|nr:flagellar FlbD family protein [Planctomycetota bacterium]MBI3835297.1 flagellar FlbD family protein [Planctomycetota bacterium]
MITVTRLDKRIVVINAEMIKMVEAAPDTIITLINGDTLMVRETVDQVVERAIDYARKIRGFSLVE